MSCDPTASSVPSEAKEQGIMGTVQAGGSGDRTGFRGQDSSEPPTCGVPNDRQLLAPVSVNGDQVPRLCVQDVPPATGTGTVGIIDQESQEKPRKVNPLST